MKASKPKREPIPYWQELIDHINETWRIKKKSDHGYPFTGKDFKDLGHYARFYQVWGMMSLWDLYLETADDYTLKRGLDIYTFTRQLPRLLDMGWKPMANRYADAIQPDLPPEFADLLKAKNPKKDDEQKRVVFKSRLEYLLAKKAGRVK